MPALVHLESKKQHAMAVTSSSADDTSTVNHVLQLCSWRKHNPVEQDMDLSDNDEVAYDSDHESDECLFSEL